MSTRTFASPLLASLALVGGTLFAPVATAQMMPSVARQAKLYNTVAVHLNAMNYFGDLVPNPAFTSLRFGATRPNLGVSYAHRFAPRLSGRVGLSYGRLTGDDQKASDNKTDNEAVYRYNRNLRFRNDLVELSALAMIDLFENRGTYLKRRDFSPYIFIGVAGFYHNPKAENKAGDFVALQPLGTEGQFVRDKNSNYPTPYKRVQIAIPFGLGVSYKLNRQFNVGYEIGWRKTFTDYLDDVSGKYADQEDLGATRNSDGTYTQNTDASYFSDRSDQAFNVRPAPGNTDANYTRFSGAYGTRNSQRGTGDEDDWYIVSGFHVSYILTPNTQSPKFR